MMMTSSAETLIEGGGGSVEMEIEEVEMEIEEEVDNNNQKNDSSSVDSVPNVHCKNPHSSTHEVFDANAAGRFELAREDNSIGKGSVDAQFCKASDQFGIHHYEKQDVSGSEIMGTVRDKAYLEDMADRKRLIEPLNYRVDATQLAESTSLPELTDSNKRPAIVCSFFAKGWCIKGGSCRFLHIKDGLGSEGKESVAIAAKQKCEHPLGKDSSVAEDSALDDGDILKQKNEVRELLTGGRGFNPFLGHETWPILSGGPSMSSSSTSWKRDPSQIQKYLGSGPKYQASYTLHFQHYSFPSPGSGMQNLPDTNQSAEYQTTLFGTWEPSIAFQPSHIITHRLLSNAKRCTPIHDNAEQAHMRDTVSQCGEEACGETDNEYAKSHANTVETFCQKYDSSNNFVSGSNFYSKEIQIDSSKIPSVNAETTADGQKDSLLTGNESSLNSIQSRSMVGADLEDGNDSEPCTDRQSHTTQPKVDFIAQDNKTDADLNSDSNAHKESKEHKIFHAALVERVKELLRQPWHDGLLSKDVFKLIVKKAVDKVISTMEPDQIPASAESIKQYFFLFKGKLTKLVEAYVDKYGKSVPG